MPDIRITSHGSVALAHPVTPAGEEFLLTRVESEGWQWMGNALAVEPRYVEGLIGFAEEEGISIVFSCPGGLR